MLDQNTDRMWYVIGAVIVGAAIILILNGTAPELFASVADTFKGKTDEVTKVVDGIGAERNYFDVALLEEGLENPATLAQNPKYSAHGGQWAVTYPSHVLQLSLQPHTMYTLSTNVPVATSGERGTLYFGSLGAGSIAHKGNSVTVKTDADGYTFVAIVKGRSEVAGILDGTYDVMLNIGDEAKSYAPAR